MSLTRIGSISTVVSTTVLLALTGGCDKREAGAASQQKLDKAPAAQASFKLPEYYGFYAIDAGKTIEVKETSKEAQEFTPSVQFLLYSKTVAQTPMAPTFFKLSLKPPPIELPQDNSFKGWDDWYKRSNDFSSAVSSSLDEQMRGVPSDATPTELRTKPVKNQPEMIQLVPPSALEPGLYQVDRNTRFWVARAQFKAQSINNAEAAMKQDRFEAAIEAAALASSLHPTDAKLQAEMKEMQFAAATGIVSKAIKERKWELATQSSRLAGLIGGAERESRPEFQSLLVDITYGRSLDQARRAISEQNWLEAMKAATTANSTRPGPEAIDVMQQIPRVPVFAHAIDRNGYRNRVGKVSFLTDGSLISDGLDGQLIVTDVSTLKTSKRWPSNSRFVTYHPTLKWIAWASESLSGSKLYLQQPPDRGSEQPLYKAESDIAQSICASPGGRFLALSNRVWYVGRDKLPESFESILKESAERAGTLKPSFLGGYEGIRATVIYDTEAHRPCRVVLDAGNWVELSPMAGLLACVMADRMNHPNAQVRVWDAHTGVKLSEWTVNGSREPDGSCASYMQFDPSGSLLAVPETRGVGIWSPRDGKKVKVLAPDLVDISVIRFSKSGKVLAVATTGKCKITLWSVEDGRMIAEMNELKMPNSYRGVTSMDFSADGKWLAAGSHHDESSLGLWRIPQNAQEQCKAPDDFLSQLVEQELQMDTAGK